MLGVVLGPEELVSPGSGSKRPLEDGAGQGCGFLGVGVGIPPANYGGHV